MRRLSVLLIGVLIMSAGFIASVMMLGDEGRLKRLLAAHVESQLGRELHIGGSVSLRLFPRLEIRASDVRLSGADVFEDIDLLRSDQLSASIRLAPLLRGQIEAENLVVEGADLNLLFDESGRHSLSGLVHYRDRRQAPGILVNGPLRLENLSLQIGRLGAENLQSITVDRVELDGLAFDRALALVFEGAIGMPAILEDVSVGGVLFVPAATGIVRLSEMRMTGRARGARSAFQLDGDLGFSAQPPLDVTLNAGLLDVDGQQVQIEGEYRAGKRPFFSLSLSGDRLDPVRLSRGLSAGDGIDALTVIAGWTALHDYELGLQFDQLMLGAWPLSNAVFRVSAESGLAAIQDARAGIPGGTLEIIGDLAVEQEASLFALQARVEIDQLSATLASAGIPLAADGVGQILIEPAGSDPVAGLAKGSLRFFDGSIDELAAVRAALGVDAQGGFDALEGQFILRSDGLEFPRLQIHRGAETLEFIDLRLDDDTALSGQVGLTGTSGVETMVSLSGTLARPQLLESHETLRPQ